MDRFLLISWLAGCVGHTDKRAQIKRAWERAGPSWRSQQLLWFLKGSCVKSKHQVWSWPGAAHLTLGRNNHPHTSSHQHTSVTCSLLSPWHRNPLCVSVHLCFMRLSANVQIKLIEMKWNVFSFTCSQASSFGPALLSFGLFPSLNAKCRCLAHHKESS